MPFISTKANVDIPHGTQERIKEKYGKAISLIPGKSEAWLMLEFCGNCHMYFGGDDSRKMAFVEVKLFGGASDKDTNALTESICKIIGDELDIAGDRIYVKYEACSQWGYDGSNF